MTSAAISNLHYTEIGVDENARKVRPAGWAATPSVQSIGTTPKVSDRLGNPEWRADMEYVWRRRVADPLQIMHKRARRQARIAAIAGRLGDVRGRVRALRSSRWAGCRARAMAMSRADVLDACGGRWRKVACGCGVKDIEVGCDQPLLCVVCRRRHWKKHRRRLVRALDSHIRAARSRWYANGKHGRLPGMYLITLTGPHSGDIGADRLRMGKAMRKLVDYGTANGWWSAYAYTWEVTPGKDGHGHVHVHLAAVSSWVPYTGEQAGPSFSASDSYDVLQKRKRRKVRLGLHEIWRRAMPGACVLDVRSPGHSRKPAAVAGEYLAKYVTKGIDTETFTGAKAGELLVAFRSRRKISVSRYFWAPLRDRDACCATCRRKHRLVGVPVSLQKHAPGAVLRAMAERIGWWIPRGTEQSLLRLPGEPVT